MYPMQEGDEQQVHQPIGICTRLFDFIKSTLLVRTFSRGLAFICQHPQTGSITPLQNPSGYRRIPGTIQVIQGNSSKHGNRKRNSKPVPSPENRVKSDAPDHRKERSDFPVHFRPHFLEVESNINEKTDEFIRSRKAAMRQTDSIGAV